MPTAPLFYQPLVMARVQATKIADTTVIDSHQAAQKQINEAYQNPKFRPAIDGIVAGFTKLQNELPGSKTLEQPQFAFDENQYLANRVMTTIRLHANLFDTASPDQAAEMGAKLVEEAKKELAENPGMRAVGDTLEVAPDATRLFQRHWEGGDLNQGDIAYLGVTASRELQRAVTPLEPDATHPQLQWIEDSSAWLLGMWPGAASRTAAALGLKADEKEVEKIVEAWRGDMQSVEPKVVAPLQSLTSILGAAGITPNGDDTARAAAYQVLQSTPLEGVPAGIAQSLVAHNQLPADKAEYLSGRIVETTGSPGNVRGLLAEIELMKQPPPVEPPPGGGAPPPGGGTPPPGPPNPEPPPGGTEPPPVDPPKEEPPKTDPPKTDPPKEEPPKTDPPKEEPPKTDPPKEEPPKTDPPKEEPKVDGEPVDPPVDGEQHVVTATGTAAGGGKPMSQEEFDKLLKEVQAELDAEQGAHPVNDAPVDPPAQA